MKRIAVIGAGYWGKNLVRNFYQLGRLDVVSDSDEEVLTKTSQQYPDVKVMDNTGRAIKDVDAVVVVTPAATHYELVRKALGLGKDVFVEKPLALTLEQGEELVELAKVRDRILMVGHLLEYHPAVRKLKEFIGSRELGEVYYIYSNRLNLGKVRKEENILWSFAPHDISVILRLMNRMPQRVSSEGDQNTTLSYLFFSGGVKAHIFVSWLNPFKEQKLVIMGSKKMAVFDDTLTKGKLVLYSHQVDLSVPLVNKSSGEIVELDDTEPLRIECEHFLECIDEERRPLTDGQGALRVLKVIKDCQESLDDKKHRYCGYFTAPTVIIESGVEIGSGTKIWHFSHVMEGARIGENCKIGKYVSIEPDTVIGNGVKIQNNVSIFSGVTLEDNVFVGPGVKFTNVKRPRSEFSAESYEDTLIGQGVTIGAGSVILCGISIGEYAFIGAGSVVTKDIPPYALVVGNPAEVVGKVDKKGEQVK